MRVLAVPVKSLDQAKRRLAGVLARPERAALTIAMLEDVLDACLPQARWEVWVISRDEVVLGVARGRGARPVSESGGSLLQAVHQLESMVPGRTSRLAVLLADLPFLTADALAGALARQAAVVAAPAASDGGTNLLVRTPPTSIDARFGRSSHPKHRAAAYREGVTFQDVRSPELAFDLDRPQDLVRVVAEPPPSPGSGGRTRSVCLEMGLPERLRVGA
jgi:2-phospho-L-lactate/phosphoenolpyruvate guanylyltransferase